MGEFLDTYKEVYKQYSIREEGRIRKEVEGQTLSENQVKKVK